MRRGQVRRSSGSQGSAIGFVNQRPFVPIAPKVPAIYPIQHAGLKPVDLITLAAWLPRSIHLRVSLINLQKHPAICALRPKEFRVAPTRLIFRRPVRLLPTLLPTRFANLRSGFGVHPLLSPWQQALLPIVVQAI